MWLLLENAKQETRIIRIASVTITSPGIMMMGRNLSQASSRSFFRNLQETISITSQAVVSPRFLLRVLSIVDLKDSPQSGVYARLQPRDLCGSYRVNQCAMLPLSTKSCLKSSKLRPILNGQFCHAIFKNICLNVLGSKQPREILVFVILKL